MQRVTRYFESMTDGATAAGASVGQAALMGGAVSIALGLVGGFTAAAAGQNIVEVARKSATAGFLVVGGLMATWNAAQTIKATLNEIKTPSLGYRGEHGLSYKVSALGEAVTYGIIGYISAPSLISMAHTLVK